MRDTSRPAVGKAGQVVLGGRSPEGLETVWYVEPTVFAEVNDSTRIAQGEISGLVAYLFEYGEEGIGDCKRFAIRPGGGYIFLSSSQLR